MASTTPGFFAPERREGRYLDFGGPVTWRRLLVRLVVFLLLLAAVDRAVDATRTPEAAFQSDYRLPRVMPTADLPDYADAIDASARLAASPGAVLFLGASPTWGHRIADAADTFPYAFESAAASAGVEFSAFNLASNGQFVGDYYVIARRLLPAADAVYVQLTYHTFNPVARDEAALRYPELPRMLGVGLSADEARLLGLPESAASPLAKADAVLGRWWLLWRERDALDRRLFGAHPRTALERAAASAAGDDVTYDDQIADDGFAAFDSLEPEQQMVALQQYAEESAFEIGADDGEVARLRRLVRLLADAKVPAVFYMAPMNRELLEEYELIDPDQYAANIAVVRQAVEEYGATFLDYNSGAVRLPAGDFADISHTTAEGGRAFGALLWADTSSTVTAVRP